MKHSLERVCAVLRGEKPDRTPIYDLLRNDAVLGHFAGKSSRSRTRRRSFSVRTRPVVRLPEREREGTHPNGRSFRQFRWTAWHNHVAYADSEAYAAAKRKDLDAFDASWTGESARAMDEFMAAVADTRRRLGEVFFFPSTRSVGLMGTYGEVGLEAFSYVLADCPDIVDELLERMFEIARGKIDFVYVAEDLGSQTGLLIGLPQIRRYLLPNQKRIADLARHHGIHIFYHTDGAVRPVIPDLIATTGIELLNPIQWRCPGMEREGLVRDFGKDLIFHGAMDNQQTLPFGSIEEVRQEVLENLRIFSGARWICAPCHNLQPVTPTANIVAMYETIREYGGG